jgi:TolB-like protein/DNA-binding winged helix-turn-helix (wHTH) protein/Flp pilus assembly protein TadD
MGKQFYKFGAFRLDASGRVLYRGEERVSLTPKVVETLLLLVENHGEMVDKDELIRRVWPSTFVEETNLTRNISVLRKALGDSEEGQEFIETIPKRGYRFIAAVAGVPAAPGPAPVVRAVPAPSRWRRTAVLVLAALAALFVGAAATYVLKRHFAPRASPQSAKVMLAVLPFRNLSGDPEQECFSDGLTEEMITQLGQLNPQRLGVIARTSAMKYKDTKESAAEIGRELGVGYLLEGSARREGDRVRISAKLIGAKDQTQMWAGEYDRAIGEYLPLQNDVAQAIAQQIRVSLETDEHAQPTSAHPVSAEVYELYQLGRYHWNRRTKAGLTKAMKYYRQAIDRDPDYAQAYAALADCYAVLPYYGGAPEAEAFFNAEAAAQHALELDEKLPEAHTTLGLICSKYQDWAGAEREYKRALDLNPNYATAHQWYALCLWHSNQNQQAIAEIERARQLDPLSVIINSDEGGLLYQARQPERAIPQLQKAIDLDPAFPEAHRILAQAYILVGRLSEAVPEARKAFDLYPKDPRVLATLGYVYARGGHREEAQKTLALLRKRVGQRLVSPFYLASVYDGLGEKELAIDSLEKAYQARFSGIYDVESLPVFDNLRSEPRFQELLRRLHSPGGI